MDVQRYLDLKPAPRAVFDNLAERKSRVRFMLPTPDGDWRAITWGAFAREIREVALFLASIGIESGDRGAVFAPNRVEWLSAALAIQSAGGVMVPIYPASTAEQAAYVVAHSDARVVFVDTATILERVFAAWNDYANVERVVLLDDGIDAAKVLAKMRAAGTDAPAYKDVEPRIVLWSHARSIGRARDAEDPKGFDRLLDAIGLDQPGVMLYTSGTSGPPKGVPLTHRNVGVNGRDWLLCNAPLLDEGAVDVLWLPMSHIFGFGEACLGNTLGFVTYFASPVDALAKLPEVRPDVFMSVPAYWDKLASAASTETDPAKRREKLRAVTGGRLKFCLSGGAGLKREVKELFHECGMLVIEGYGLTETSPTLTLNRPDAFRFDSVGKPLPSVELRLAEDGEILAKGPNVFGGYHKDAAATRDAFTADGWFKTGDVGRWTDDGFLQIVDRKKDILVTAGGKNVPPANIEIRFADDPLLAHVVVYGDAKKFLVAGVWVNDAVVDATLGATSSAAAREEAVRVLVQQRIDRVNTQLASHESIKKFVVVREPLTVNNGLLTASLKVKRKAVYTHFRDAFEALYEESPSAEKRGAAEAR
jgi:long-chain acyl-CoA synthetase